MLKNFTYLMETYYKEYMKPENIPLEEIAKVCKSFTSIDQRALDFIDNYKKKKNI